MAEERLTCFVSIQEWIKETSEIRTLCGQKLWISNCDNTVVACSQAWISYNTEIWKKWFSEYSAQRLQESNI